MTDVKKIVFILGFDKNDARGETGGLVNTPWMFYHLHPSTYTKPVKGEGKTFDLVLFDYQAMVRKTWKAFSAKRSTGPPPRAADDSVPLLPKVDVLDNRGDAVMDKAGEPLKLPTVLAFYRWVKTQPAKSIVSIQIFSHGVIPLPIVYPFIYEYRHDPWTRGNISADRDPLDTEFRLRDFEGKNPLNGGDPDNPGIARAGSELDLFRRALDPEVFIKIWGCGEMTREQDDGGPIRNHLRAFVKAKAGAAGDAQRSTLILRYLDYVKQYWPFRLAERLGMPVWAGPVGWGSDPHDVDGEYNPKTYARNKYHYVGTFPPNLDKKEWWWRVSLDFRKNKLKIAEKFYRDALKAKMDVMGYVEYTKAWVTAAEKAANAALDPAKDPRLQPARQLLKKLTDQMERMRSGRSTQ